MKSICDTYMSLGGVATYLKSLDYSKTPEQALHGFCFEQNGILTQEYKLLYRALFKNAETHELIMTILSRRWEGCTKSELGKKLGVTQRIVRIVLEELIASGFVSEIKKALGLNGAPTTSHYWAYRAKSVSEKGAQIDLLLKYEGTKNIDIVECKYYNDDFQITKKYKEELINKRNVFNQMTNNRYNVRLIIVTPFGVSQNQYFNELSPQVVTLKDLFQPGL